MPHAQVNGIRVYHEVHGTGEPLLWIGGLGANILEIPYLIDAYSKRFQFIVFDSRGCGRSDKPAEDYSMPGFADDTAHLLGALGIDSAYVYGSSMGGMIAQELALRHPERVRALVLGCTTAGAVRGVQPSPETIQKMIRNQSLAGDEALEAGWELGYSRAYIAANRESLFERARNASRHAAPKESYMRQVLAAAKHDTYDRLSAISCPVLIIHGSEDVMIPSGNAHLLKDHIPHAELVILEGMGHGYNLEAQERADAAVIEFLGRCGAVSEGATSAAR